MEFRVVYIESEEGFAVSCPDLRGCHSQGATREEARENTRIAIREWLEAGKEEGALFDISQEMLAV